MKKSFFKAGNKIPYEFFITSGIGESDITIHAGSFDETLRDAGIHNANISFLFFYFARDAKRIKKPKELPSGCVLEMIMAVAYGKKGERVTAGLILGRDV